MKRYEKIFTSAIIVAAMCLTTSCSDGKLCETIVEETLEECHWQCTDINLEVQLVCFDTQMGLTRSIDDGWKGGDRIYLILKDKDGNNVQAYVEYDASVASWGQVEFYGNKSSLICSTPRTIEAYYFDGEMDVTDTDVTFDATTGIYACKDGVYTYPADGDLKVSVLLTPLTGRIRFTGEPGVRLSIVRGMKGYTGFSRTTGRLTEALIRSEISVDETGTTPYLYGVFDVREEPYLIVRSNGDAFKRVFESSAAVLQIGNSGYMPIPTAVSHRGWKLTEPVTALSLDRNTLVISKGNTATLQASLTPAEDVSPNIIWLSSDTSIAQVSETGVVTAVAIGSATITAVAYENKEIKAMCSVTVFDANGHEYVDLGLTSGTLWATMNVGASFPVDGGSYFAWGEVEEKETYSWSTYKYCNGTGDVMTKYNDVDNLTELELSDDAARYHWGGSWRMPSGAQFGELCRECTCTWTTLKGVGGYQITSKKNANAIFLPAAGGFWGGDDNSIVVHSGVAGCYWSRSFFIPSETGSERDYSNGIDVLYIDSSWFFNWSVLTPRYYGMSLRPVLCRE